MSNISFSEDAWEDYLYWQIQDKKTLKKINELLKEIQRTPFSGKGEPEKLRGDLNGKWSRRINLKDRLVYEISDETITPALRETFTNKTHPELIATLNEVFPVN